MKQKGAGNGIFIIVILVLLVIIGYLVFNRGNKSSLVINENTGAQTGIVQTLPGDDSLIREGSDAYKREFPDQPLGTVTVAEKADITGDGLSEFVLNTGNGGATSDAFSIFRWENNTAVYARFKEKSGEVKPAAVLSGSGGAGRYGFSYKLMPDDHAILITDYSIYGTTDDFCSASVYVWNPQTKVFDYNSNLSVAPQKDLQKTCTEIKVGLGL
jgi:hypothetical protein